MFVLIFVNFKPRALSREPSGDRVMPRTEVQATAICFLATLRIVNEVLTLIVRTSDQLTEIHFFFFFQTKATHF